jgi:hypothetical protein
VPGKTKVVSVYIATINENNLVLKGGARWKNSWLSAYALLDWNTDGWEHTQRAWKDL